MACIPKAAKLMQLLTDLMRKSAVFRWSESQNKAFLDTKQALVNATTLQHPSAMAKIQLVTNAVAYVRPVSPAGPASGGSADRSQQCQPPAFS